MKDAIQIIQQIDGGIVLDAATGRGDFINMLKQYLKSFDQIIGVDYSEKSVDYAQKLFPENNVEIYRMNLENLDFEDGHFDTVCTAYSLHHFEHIDTVFEQMMRVLKPGGVFLLAEMYADGEQSAPQMTHVLMHHWVASVDSLSGIYHSDTFSKDEIIALAKKLKLQKLKIVDYYPQVDNPKSPKACADLIKCCEATIKRLETIKGQDALIEEGKSLIQRIGEVGYASASRLLIKGYKKKGDK
ncbi:MAG: class I SAM-dependent methyltransferase [Candidatus Cloacimonetes bacterium]|nr:class I SAM-dependent methyltransferase [Candidatus Cloacimonadota bacterium]MCK9184476.1 class I SAM-dependent methyltransferase [Candidatus Cloacimonadota bacterium]MCK9583353.1 class I SAM-dependent methyltransferase [Candidatus Cloacimonadota bacterium]